MCVGPVPSVWASAMLGSSPLVHSVACLESAALMLAAAYVGLLLLLRGACKTGAPVVGT